jgi:hypothetical protein
MNNINVFLGRIVCYLPDKPIIYAQIYVVSSYICKDVSIDAELSAETVPTTVRRCLYVGLGHFEMIKKIVDTLR